MNIETLAPYLLPLAMGLAGAALYHLIGPIWFLVRCALWPVWMTIGAFSLPIHWESAEEWHRRLFPSKPEASKPNPATDATLRFGKSNDDYAVIELVNCTDDKTPSVNVKYDGALKFVAVNQRLDALEERMGKVEEGSDVDYDAMWHGAKHVAEEDCPYIAYGSTRAIAGKPCPKPTKDLRPGDEVSIRARVTTVGENRIHLDAPKDTPNAYLHVAVDVDELNKLRTDNK